MRKFISLILFFLLFSGTAFAGGTIQWPTACFFDSNGDPLSGGKLYSYVAGTSTAKALYSDRAATTAHTNPEILDSNGCTEVYGIGTYKLVLKDSADSTTYFSDDNVTVSTQTVSYYYPNYNATDICATGNSDTIKFAVDTISTDSGTIILQHNSGSATTTYTCSTSETIPANVRLIIENGALIADDASNATFTINGALEAGNHQAFNWGTGTGKVVFGSGPGHSINAMWFTGVPDGSTSNDTAFQLAIDSCPTRGAKLYVPATASKFVLENVEIYRPLTLYGDGRGSVLQAKSDATGYMIYINGDHASVVVNEDGGTHGQLYGVIIRDLTLHGNARQSDIGALNMYKAEHMSFKNLYIEQFQRESIKLAGIRESTFENIHTRWCGNRTGDQSGYPDINLYDPNTGHDTNNGIYFDKLYSVYPMGDTVWLDTDAAGSVAYNVRQINFDNCFLHGLIPAVDDGGGAGNPMSATFSAAQKAYKHFDIRSADNVIVSSCHITGGGEEQNTIHLQAGTGPTNDPTMIKFFDNTFEGRYSWATGADAANDIVIKFEDGYLFLEGNYIAGSGTALASNLTVNSGAFIVLGKNFLGGEGPALNGTVNYGVTAFGAADTTPSVAGKHVFKTGGALTLTDFDDGYYGQEIIILANHNTTFDYDAGNIVPVGGADHAIVAGDTATFVLFEDNKWYMTSWSDNT